MLTPPISRVIRGTVPTGSYAASTAPQLQGRAGNKTTQYLDAMLPNDPGAQGFHREALTGIPHPLNPGQTMNYGQLQDLLHGPHGAAALESYRATHRLDKMPTADDVQRVAFDQARADLLARAAQKPGELAFPASADAARRAPNTAQQMAHGNFLAADAPGQVVNGVMQAQRYADLPVDGTAYAAPGMATRPGVAPPAVPARVIRGGLAAN